MLISSQVFKELEFFQGILSPGLVEVKRRIEELQLQQLERLRKNFEEKGIERSHIVARPFEAPQDAPEDMNCGSAAESVLSPSVSVGGGLRFPKVMSGTCHCGVLTPEGALWLWGRNDRLQLSREKSVCHYTGFPLAGFGVFDLLRTLTGRELGKRCMHNPVGRL